MRPIHIKTLSWCNNGIQFCSPILQEPAIRRSFKTTMFSKVFEVFDRPPIDRVTYNLPFFGSPWPVTCVVVIYLLFVLKIGKLFMKHREPYNLRNILIVYNFCQVIYNGVLCYFMYYYLFIEPIYDLRCMETLQLDNPNKSIERYISYAYYINKIIDLLDTVFFVLRKSYKQITTLHVYHHVLMSYILYWVVQIYGVGGQFGMMGFLNTFVHTVMYFYYLISAMKTGIEGNLWWKKYITKIQIIQFSILLFHSLLIWFNPECKYPTILQSMLLLQSIVFLSLFFNFYIKAYKKSQHQKQI